VRALAGTRARLEPATQGFALPYLTARWQVSGHRFHGFAVTLTIMRMADADDLIAVDVFNAAQSTGQPLTMVLVRRVVDGLLAHPPECGCGRCEAAAIARVGDVLNIASGWQRAIAATKSTRVDRHQQRAG
jgi:hypothetical protein